jgi:HEAT repeat protein
LAERGIIDPSCLGKAITLLRYDDITVRSSAARLIGHLAAHDVFDEEDERCLPRLIGLMNEEVTRGNACWALARLAERGIYSPSSLEAAIDLLHDHGSDIRREAANLISLLAERGVFDSKCIPRLIELMDDEETRFHACYALDSLAEEGACNSSCLEKVVKLLDDPEISNRQISTWLIGSLAMNNIYDTKCLPRLIELMDDQETRSSAVHALAELADKGICDSSCLQKTIEALGETDAFNKITSVWLIGGMAKNGIFDARCLPLFIKMFEESNEDLLIQLINALTICYPMATEEERSDIAKTIDRYKGVGSMTLRRSARLALEEIARIESPEI